MHRVQRLTAHLAGEGSKDANAKTRVVVQPSETRANATTRAAKGEYDYVVVGGGSAGCVVASRLSEDPNVTVLLLEAGSDNQSYKVRWPLITCPYLQNSEYDWAFRTTPQEETGNRVSFQPRGKALGGSSSINYMLYVRGDPRNWDQYAHEDGCGDQWAYENMLPLFKKSENFQGSKQGVAPIDTNSHGSDGPLDVTGGWDPKIKMWSSFANERFVDACNEAGIPRNGDYNGPIQDGASVSQVTVKDGKRIDTATAFLYKNNVMERPNLTVVLNAHVAKVVFQDSQAIGVVYKVGKDTEKLKSPDVPYQYVGIRREAILCAGAYGTPQLLQLSGVGPREHLEELGIPVVADLPGVGSNLQDHLMVPVVYEVLPERTEHEGMGFLAMLKSVVQFLVFSQGILMLPFVTAMAFLRSGLRKIEDGNDLQIHWVPYVSNKGGNTSKNNLGLDPKVNPRYDASHNPEKGVVLLASLIRPHSTGSVRLGSSSPFDPPVIDPRYLSDARDLEALTVCYKKCRHLAENTKALGTFLGKEKRNPHSKHAFGSDAYIEECIREEVVTIYHPTSTTKMGPVENPDVVVDARTLKVKGFDNLRVADVSVLPNIVSGNTNAPAIVIGEKCAALIAEENAKAFK